MNNCNSDLSGKAVPGDCYGSVNDKTTTEATVRKRKKAIREQWKKEVAEAQTLEDIVRIYEKYDLRNLEAFLIGLKNGKTVELICGKIPNPNPNPLPEYNRHPHQNRLSNKTIKDASEEFKVIADNKYPDFTALYEAVKEIGDRVSGIGALAVYDFSIRYGYSKGLQPEEEVYMHAGTLIGAESVLGKERKIKVWDKIPVSEFPKEMRKLNGLHLENLLCIYKKKLKEITSKK